MSLSNKDLSDIASEIAASKDQMATDKANIPKIDAQVQAKQASADKTAILYRDSNDERVDPYQTERSWLDGVTATPITQQQIDDAAARTSSNIFFPITWSLSNAKLTPSGNGNPTTTNSANESSTLNNSIENNGLISMINLLRNGQAGSSGTFLTNTYSPGDTAIALDSVNMSVNSILYISGSGTSAAVRITDLSLGTIVEIIPPAHTITSGGSVASNIPGFSNAERTTLTSGSYQNILTQLTGKISISAGVWGTALNNQLTQLKINIDNPSQITTAKTNVQNAITAYSNWNALSNTGASGKYVNSSLDNLANAYNTRNSGFSSRISEITAALGSVSQDDKGNYSGNGQYLQRFKSLNFLINSANGPLYEKNAIANAKGTTEAKVANGVDKLATYANITRYMSFTSNSTGTSSISVDNATQFSNGDNIVITGSDLPSISATIVSISGTTVTLDKNIPKEYTKTAKAGIIKAV
jgi:hypothetical protein